MDESYGPQYSQDDAFKAKARLLQSQFRKEILKANFQDYGNRLAVKDALEGKNFYSGCPNIFKEAKRRYPLKYTPLYYDMLRSEHIPFNFLVPFECFPELGVQILNHFMKGVMRKIEKIKIEYAPKPRERYLNDMTSFDSYVEYEHCDGTRGFLGIEVKYTEREYPYGKKEKAEIEDSDSIYNRLTNRICIYKQVALYSLKSAKYKQVWRNQLLGERILEVNQAFKHFTSVILFPKDNLHFAYVCNTYKDFLKDEFARKFIGITFEDFIATGKRYVSRSEEGKWLGYLESRYLISK